MANTLTGRWVVAGALGAAMAFSPLACADRDPDEVGLRTATTRPGASAQPRTLAKLDYTVKDMDGRDVSLASFKGKPLVINFWATWCGPCKQEIPQFVQLADRYRDKGLTILGVSTDDEPADLRRFAPTLKMNYPVLVGLGQDKFLETYEADGGIPVTWFIRADGSVAGKHEGYNTLDWFDAQIRALFDTNAAGATAGKTQ